MARESSNISDYDYYSNALLAACTEQNWGAIDNILQHDLNPNIRDKSGRTSFHIVCDHGLITIANALLGKGADLEAKYNFGRSALHVAGESGREQVVDFLIKSGANLEAKDNVGRTTLQRVCYKGFLPLAMRLVDAGANFESQDETGSYALHSACEKGHTHITSLLLERGSNINCKDNFGRSPLHLACLYDHLDTVTWLYDHQASLDLKDIDGRTPLHVASFKDHTEIVAYLISVGADLEATSNDGRTALHCSAIKGHTETLFYILDKGAKTEAIDANGLTPLHCACDVGQLEAASCLLDQGANIEAVDASGKTAMQRVCEKGKWKVASYLRDRGAQLAPGFEAIDSALRHAHFTAVPTPSTPDLEVVELDSQELFLVACETGDLQKCAYYVDSGVTIDLCGRAGYAGLHKACVNGHLELAMFLLDKGANIENCSRSGRTALHCAVENGYVDLVYALLNRSADVDARTSSGKTSLYLACDWSVPNAGSAIVKSGSTSGLSRAATPSATSPGRGAVDDAVDSSGTEYGRENCYNRHVELAAALLEYGANTTLKPPGISAQNPCQIADSSGNLILHRALIQSTYLCSFEESYFVGIVLSLLKAYPGGARVRNKASQFPLNIALENDASIDVVGPLIEATMLRRHEINSICRSALYSSWCNIDSLHYMLYALQQKHVAPNIHVHLLGDSMAGKTTACRALTYLLAPAKKMRRESKTSGSSQQPTSSSTAGSTTVVGAAGDFFGPSVDSSQLLEPVSWLGTLSPARKVKSIDTGAAGRTVGLDFTPIRTGKISWLLHDYGGRSIFHGMHGCFLARPRSIFIIVVSPWDVANKRLLSDDAIVASYRYWVRFINSVADRPVSGTPSLACLTVINMLAEVESAERGRTRRVKDLIASEQQAWNGCLSASVTSSQNLSSSTLPTAGSSSSLHQLNVSSSAGLKSSPGKLNAESSSFAGHKNENVPPTHSGYMLRQSEVQKSWRRRFYVLHGGVLRYYDSDPNSAPSQVMRSSQSQNMANEVLLDVAGMSVPPNAQIYSQPTIPKPAGEMFLQDYSVQTLSETRFVLVNLFRKSRELVLEVEDPEQRHVWISAFKKHIQYLRQLYRIQLVGEPQIINTMLTTEVNGLLTSLNEVVKSMNVPESVIPRCMEAVLNDMIVENPSNQRRLRHDQAGNTVGRAASSNAISNSSNVTPIKADAMLLESKWPSVLTSDAMRDDFIIPALRQLRTSDSSHIDKCVFQWLYSLVLKQLVSAGEVVLATAEDGKTTWAVTDVNWLTRDLLGRLIATMYDKQPYVQPMLTVPQLNSMTGDVSHFFDGDETVFPQLLTALGVCIPISDITGPYIPQKEDLLLSGSSYGMLLFPLFVDIPSSPADIQPMLAPVSASSGQKYYRQIGRRFKLKHPVTQCAGFPVGYTASLFSAIAELEHNTRDIIMTRDYLIIQRCYSLAGTIGNRVEIIVKLDEPTTEMSGAISLTVIVSTLMAHPPGGGRSYAWRRMQSICDIIRNRHSKKQGLNSNLKAASQSASAQGDGTDSRASRSRGGSFHQAQVSVADETPSDDEADDPGGLFEEENEHSRPAVDEGKCDHAVEGFRQSLGMVLTWVRNVDVVEWCVNPSNALVEETLAKVMSALHDASDPRSRSAAQLMYYGINERGVAAVEESVASPAIDSAAMIDNNERASVSRRSNGARPRSGEARQSEFLSVSRVLQMDENTALADTEVFFDILEQLN